MISGGCIWIFFFWSWRLRTEEDNLTHHHLLPDSAEPSASHALSDDEMSDKSSLSLDQKADHKTGKFLAMENHFSQGELSFAKHLRHNHAVLFWWAEWVYVWPFHQWRENQGCSWRVIYQRKEPWCYSVLAVRKSWFLFKWWLGWSALFKGWEESPGDMSLLLVVL